MINLLAPGGSVWPVQAGLHIKGLTINIIYLKNYVELNPMKALDLQFFGTFCEVMSLTPCRSAERQVYHCYGRRQGSLLPV